MAFTVAVLTVSDTASKDSGTDRSGPKIQEIINSNSSFSVSEEFYRIVQDDKEEIQNIVRNWIQSNKIDWIITTGGTGFGVRDITPEALSPLIERHAPGIVHLLLSSSLSKTPFAALSRPVAGTAQSTLITTLPGSVKAVKENMEALLGSGIVQHALDLVKGGTGQQVHSQLSEASHPQEPGHHHHHHHHHHHEGHHAPKPRSQVGLSHDPTASVAARHRKSQFDQISLEQALELIKQNVEPLGVVKLPVNADLGGHILAEDIYAPQDVPSTFTTSVDGYAIRSSDPPGVYDVLTSQTHKTSDHLQIGSIYRINTGGPLPVGTDAVIMVEDTKLVSTHQQTSTDSPIFEEEKQVETLAQIPPYENVRKPGSDVKKGELVMAKGEKITKGGGEIGTLAFVGRKEVSAFKKPTIAILSTGNEIIDIQDNTISNSSGGSWGGIFDTNRPSLKAALENLGYKVLDLGIVQDDVQTHLSAIKRGLAEADLLLTTGGTSMGPTDLLKPIIERYLDGIIHFGRVSVKPGKPTTFARVPVQVNSDVELSVASSQQVQVQVAQKSQVVWKPIFALPGNPASALVTFYVFVVPALRKMGGWPSQQLELPQVNVELQNTMPLDPRTEYHRIVLKSSFQSGSAFLKAHSTGGQRSSRAASLCNANALVILPPLETAGKKELKKGEYARALVLGEIEME